MVVVFGSMPVLRSERGEVGSVTLTELQNAPDFEILGQGATPQPATSTLLDTLTKHERGKYRTRLADINEVLTGYRSGDPDRALPFEPRPDYDPTVTTQEQRVEAKARETGRSKRTIKRDLQRLRDQGEWGLVDKRSVRPVNGSNLDPRVHTAVERVLDELTDLSTVTHREVGRRSQQRLDDEFGPGVVKLPPQSTFNRQLTRLLKVRGIYRGSARARRSAAARSATPYQHFHATRPGEYVQIDLSPYDVFAVDKVTREWVSLVLVLALDLYTRSIVAWAFTPKDPKGVDAALLLHDMISPKPLRPGWPEEARWRYLGVPETVVIGGAAENGSTTPLAGIPALYPETVVVDRGAIFLSETFQNACALLGISIQLARPKRPTDKPQVERAFQTIFKQLVEKLPGYKGPDVHSRGARPEDEALLFVDELEELFARYVALHWQERAQNGLRLPELPEIELSPNRMYDEGLARWGCIQLPASVNLQYDLLPTAWRKVHHYGVQLYDLFYDGVALNGYRNELSPYNGAHKGKWPIKYDPRDLRSVYFQDPQTHAWNELGWTGGRKDQHPFGDVSLRFLKARIKDETGYSADPETLARRLDELVAGAWEDAPRRRRERRLAAKERVRAGQAGRTSQLARLPELEREIVGDLFDDDAFESGEQIKVFDPDEGPGLRNGWPEE